MTVTVEIPLTPFGVLKLGQEKLWAATFAGRNPSNTLRGTETLYVDYLGSQNVISRNPSNTLRGTETIDNLIKPNWLIVEIPLTPFGVLKRPRRIGPTPVQTHVEIPLTPFGVLKRRRFGGCHTLDHRHVEIPLTPFGVLKLEMEDQVETGCQ